MDLNQLTSLMRQELGPHLDQAAAAAGMAPRDAATLTTATAR